MITSTSNNRIKEVSALIRRAKVRRDSAVFAVEGTRMLLEVPAGFLTALFVSESFAGKEEYAGLLEKRRTGGEAGSKIPDPEIVSESVFSKMCDTMHPQGVLGLAKKPVYTKEDLEKILLKKEDGTQRRFLIAENVQDPGNLGTMLRTAEAAGMDAVFFCGSCADLFNPKTVRSTMGSIFRVPFFSFAEAGELISILHNNGIAVYAAALEGSVPYTKAPFGKAAAIIIGNEGNGVLAKTRSLCDGIVRIPMDGQVESLNAAISAALLMYEIRRQQNAGI